MGGGVLSTALPRPAPWPARRLTELLEDDPKLNARWQSARKQSFAMADNAEGGD